MSQPGGITLEGVPIDLRKIKTPTFILSTREDHIAPWRSTYAATQLYRGPITFVLSALRPHRRRGQPAGGQKYGYWTNDELPPDPRGLARGRDRASGLLVAGLG